MKDMEVNHEERNKQQEIVSLVLVFIVFIFIFFGIKYIWALYNLPGPSDLIESSRFYFTEYGLIIFFFTALLEALLLIGNYFPGTLILLFGLSTMLDSPQKVLETYIYISLGMLSGYSINYFLGKYGWYKIIEKIGYKEELKKIEARLEDNGFYSVLFLYLLPGFGSLLSTSFGILRFNFIKFFLFTTFMILFWNFVWAIAVYVFGKTVFELFNSGYLALVLAAGYLIYLHKSGRLQQITEQSQGNK